MKTNPFGLSSEVLDTDDWSARLGSRGFEMAVKCGILKPPMDAERLDGQSYQKLTEGGRKKEYRLWVEKAKIHLVPENGAGETVIRPRSDFYTLDVGALSSTLLSVNGFDPPTAADPLLPGLNAFGSRLVGKTRIRWYATPNSSTLRDVALCRALQEMVPKDEVWLISAASLPREVETQFAPSKRVVPVRIPGAEDDWRLRLAQFCRTDFGISFSDARAVLATEYKLLVSDDLKQVFLLGQPFRCKFDSDVHRLLVGLARLDGGDMHRADFLETYLKKQNSALDEAYRQLRDRLPKEFQAPERLAEAMTFFPKRDDRNGLVRSPFKPGESLIYK